MRGVSEPNVWLYSSSWITTQELGLKAVFKRQPTVYSYTASHRSPCIRVDSPTQFHHHRHDHYHHDSQIKYPQCNSKHAIRSNSCRGYIISTNSYICYF